MQMHRLDIRVGRSPHNANRQLIESRLSAREVIGLQDKHVTTVAVTIEMTSHGCVSANRRDHLQELIANRHQRIFQAEFLDFRVSIADSYIQKVLELSDCRRQIACGDDNLANAQTHWPRNFGSRFSTNDRAPSR
jgi:hypothetical protein